MTSLIHPLSFDDGVAAYVIPINNAFLRDGVIILPDDSLIVNPLKTLRV